MEEGTNGQAAGGYATDGYEAIYREDWYGPGGMMSSGNPEPVDRGQELKKARRHFSKLGGMFLLGTIVIYAVQLIVMGAVSLLRPEWMWDGDISLLISMLPMYLVGMPVLILLVKTLPAEKPQRRSIGAGQFLVAVIMCFGFVYITNFLGNIITSIIGILKGGSVQNQLMDVTGSVSLWMIALYMVICAPILEEYIFRKLIVDRTIRYGQGTAVLVSGLMFGLFHGNLNQFVYAFVLGAFLAFLYVKTGNLKITIAIHMMINFMGGLVSSALMRMIDLDEYAELAMGMDMESLMEYVSGHMAGLLAYGAFLLFVFGSMIAGLVIFIVCLVKDKITFQRGAVSLLQGERFRTVFWNLGMAAYCIFWIGMIVYQLFM